MSAAHQVAGDRSSTYTFGTPFGPAEITVATTDAGRITIDLDENAAQVLARMIGHSAAVVLPDSDDHDSNTWNHVVVDLLASAAHVSAPEQRAALVSGYLPPRSTGRRIEGLA